MINTMSSRPKRSGVEGSLDYARDDMQNRWDDMEIGK
jgi:hypothetical protein